MLKLIIYLTVALVTFFIGISLASILTPPLPRQADQIAKEVDHVSPQDVPEGLAVLPADLNGPEMWDLTMVVNLAEPYPNPPSLTYRHIDLNKNGPTVIDLDLGEDIENQEVILNFRDSSAEHRMFQRYRTSMTISAEGPHIDLIDSRHFDSPWMPLRSLGAMRFRTLSTDQMDASKFPSATKSEILKEARRVAEKDWRPYIPKLVEDCHGPNQGACVVSISSLYLRIQKRVRTRWIDVGLVEVRLPMGC